MSAHCQALPTGLHIPLLQIMDFFLRAQKFSEFREAVFNRENTVPAKDLCLACYYNVDRLQRL